MTKTLKLLGLLLAFSSNAAFLHAQSTNILVDTSKEQNIIIRKKNSSNEKVTVVIDGNNITVNGKPIDDFKSKDIDIIKQDMADNDFEVLADGDMHMMAPPPPQARSFNNDMMHSIKSNSAFLGVMTEKNDQGAKITDVTDGSSAEKAGLKEGDIITKIGEDKITGPDDLYKAVGKRKPADNVTITYLRDGKQATANTTLGKSEQVKVYSWNTPGGDEVYKNYSSPYNFSFSWNGDKPRLGISAQDTEDGNGVKILDLDDDDSPAAKAGLKEGDIITQVNGKAITSTEDLKQNMQELKKGDTVKITYKRNNQTQTVDVKFPKELKTVDL